MSGGERAEFSGEMSPAAGGVNEGDFGGVLGSCSGEVMGNATASH